MLNTKYTRTTLSLPDDLLFEIKKKALMERKTLKEIISESLTIYLGKDISSKSSSISLDDSYGAWGKGLSGTETLRRVRYGKTEEEEKKELKLLAKAVIGSVSLKQHPNWQTKQKITSWLKKIRNEWT